ncbi:START-like domain [Plasmopara halstedii]|uniref:START-like domain n=1 Tax=Plasmopara halstedii TaxID=4781 RepID=A0A0P1AHH8_PLAHL|nr:START-like domain [Plasmopara halstedii]CEG39951.1 START-like domain [Plasmopara halstedii]|eukprot:XP_024576320.1 START-like domain [Plasmopara halstedii]
MASSQPSIQFSASRRAELDSQCDDLLISALKEHDKFHTASDLQDWQLVRRRNALNVYRPRVAITLQDQHFLLGSGIVPGTLDDTLNGVYCDTTESLRICKTLLSDKFLDGAVLRVFEAHDLQAPVSFAGIKWFMMRGILGTSGLLSDRDVLTYERMGHFRDQSGQCYAYHILQSIDLPEYPANRERGVQRVDLSLCYLYRQLTPDWLGSFVFGYVNLNTNMPMSLASFIAAEKILSANKFLRCARAKYFSALMVKSMEIEVDKERPECVVCRAMPAKILGLAHKMCMGCRRQVCWKCRERRQVFHMQLRSGKPATEYFCHSCVNYVTGNGYAQTCAGLDDVYERLCGTRIKSFQSSDEGTEEYNSMRSKSDASMRLCTQKEFICQSYKCMASNDATITWNEAELLEITQFLETLSNRFRRRERRKSGSSLHTVLRQGTRYRFLSDNIVSSSIISTAQQETPPDYDVQYNNFDSPSSLSMYSAGENQYFEDDADECRSRMEPKHCVKWTVVYDEDVQEFVKIPVPITHSTRSSEVQLEDIRETKIIRIDELD